MQTKPHNRRIFPGVYRSYEGKYVQVINVVKDIDTDEEVVICRVRSYGTNPPYFVISKKSFCELVLVGNKYVGKYKRNNLYPVTEYELDSLQHDGYDVRRRMKRREKQADPYTDEKDQESESKSYWRSAPTYYGYAKLLCADYACNLRRHNLCVKEKRLIGFCCQDDYKKISEDLRFMKVCLDTVLKEFVPFFKERYIGECKSVRVYAAEHNMNRGSVEYLQKKLFAALAHELEARDKAEGVCRLFDPDEE